MAARRVVAEVPAWRKSLAKWAYGLSYFPQLGLMRDDILNETPNVKEALRRLPRDVYDSRQFRISRALNLSNKKDILPKDEWQKYEEDVRYLKPYLDEVVAEIQEKAEWAKK
ncbi:cytochrome b-c1 complex subunit 7-like [Haliotis rufescens]|uniref:cytochrome b-c1 complex subunit 7-like n=1 Tax=Haliotis rufescens TaxID=6454 RepID=UPI001EB09BEB|nr:cytochrome b-c1 complex subunit 7-like [Haliotis rufescens]